MRFAGILAGAALAAAGAVAGSEFDALISPSPEGAEVYIIEPRNGDRVPSTFSVKFGLRGMGVAPAGSDVPGTGHHHLLVDRPAAVNLRAPLPATEQLIHFGKGQTETVLTLPPGKHVLQLLLANHLHIPHDPPVVSEEIEITVVAD